MMQEQKAKGMEELNAVLAELGLEPSAEGKARSGDKHGSAALTSADMSLTSEVQVLLPGFALMRKHVLACSALVLHVSDTISGALGQADSDSLVFTCHSIMLGRLQPHGILQHCCRAACIAMEFSLSDHAVTQHCRGHAALRLYWQLCACQPQAPQAPQTIFPPPRTQLLA